MRDKIMKVLGLFTALSLAVCLIASGIVLNTGSSYAATSSLRWTQISIPDKDNMQLYPGSDIGPMAVSPDGATVFAAVNKSSGHWELLKSTDGAFSWQDTGLSSAMVAIGDVGNISAVKISPSWNTDGRVYVATENRVYKSGDRGRTFDDLTPVPGTTYAGGTDVITSLDLGLDSSGKIVVVAGTKDPTAAVGGEVYIKDVESGVWIPQHVGTYDVLAVGLSPSYAMDQAVIAVVTNADNTSVRTKLGTTGAWDGAVPEATSNLKFPSYRACIGFPEGYQASGSGVRTLFVGLAAVGPLGDVFRINGGWKGTPSVPTTTVVDLNVRGYEDAPTTTNPTETNIWSMAVSGSASSMDILVGTEALNTSALPVPPSQLLVYTSYNSGGNWSPSYDEYLSYKQPTGESQATVIMTPSVAYVGTFGNQSAVSAALSADGGGFNSWNQRGLIDTNIDGITDMSPSQNYFVDTTMYITTRDAGTGDTSLWRTETGGGTWERVYCSTLAGPETCVFDMVRIASGGVVVLAQSGSKEIVPSNDGGTTFQTARGISLTENISAFAIADGSTYYAGGANGSVQGTADGGATWTASTGSEIPITDTVVDLVLTADGDLYAGTNNGGVYSTNASDFAFVQVGPGVPGAPGGTVHVAPDLYEGSYVYVGIQGGAATQGIWRFDTKGGDEAVWEHIADSSVVGDVSSLACDDQSGVLYAVSGSMGIGWRSINPATIKEEPVFEEINKGLGAGDSVKQGLKLVSNPNILFAVGGSSYTQLWTTSDEIVKMKLLSPKSGSIAGTILGDLEDKTFLGRAMVMLEWKQVEDAESYEVQIAFDENMGSPVDMSYYGGDPYSNGTPYSDGMVKVVYPWLGGKYYWRVRVGKAGPSGTEGAPYMSQWSDIWTFTTPLGPAPSIPELVSPAVGQGNVMLKPVLQWNSSVAATGYELILATNCDFGNPVVNLSGESAVSDTAYQVKFNLAKNTSYCWRVRGVNDITHSLWSDTGTFTTGYTAAAENVVLPIWIWVIIALATVFVLSILVLITQSRRY